ncbi:hypothetical protein ACQ4LE_002990 [Meloidogyne hapla]
MGQNMGQQGLGQPNNIGQQQGYIQMGQQGMGPNGMAQQQQVYMVQQQGYGQNAPVGADGYGWQQVDTGGGGGVYVDNRHMEPVQQEQHGPCMLCCLGCLHACASASWSSLSSSSSSSSSSLGSGLGGVMVGAIVLG